MAVIVELSGDAAKLLRAHDQAIEKALQHERKLMAMANAGDHAGQTLETALERVRKEEDKVLKSLMGDLKKLGPEGGPAIQALGAHFTEAGRAGQKSFESIAAQIQKIDPTTAAVFDQVRANMEVAAKAADWNEGLADLQKYGPTGAAMAAAVAEHFQKAAAETAGGLEAAKRKMIELDPTSAAVFDKVAANMAEASKAANFRDGLAELNQFGPTGQAMARAISEDMQKAAMEAAGGLDAVINKMIEIDPTVAQSAERVKQHLAEAAKYSEGRWGSSLNELRKFGPVGREMADQMKKHFVAAGELSEKSIQDVIEEIRKIDPAAAEAAEKMYQNIEAANKKGESGFARFAKSSMAKIMSMAGAFLSVQEAVNVVNKSLEVQEGLIKSAYDRQIELAKAQQESAKNFAGMTAFEQSGMLKEVPFRIAQQAGFSDVPAIQSALGNAVSAGASFEDAEAAVLAAARSNRLTPEKLSAAASASIDLGKSTGSKDVISNLALLTTTGTQARIEDPLALAKTLAPTLNNVANSLPSEGKETAPVQGAALFAALTQYATDGDGKRSETATTQFTGELAKFFGDLEMQQRNARSKVELIDRKIDKGKDTEKDRFEREQLKQFLKDSEGLKDPGTLSGRIQTLQSNEGVRNQFYSRDFGEQAFKGAFAKISDSTSDIAKAFEKYQGIITNNPESFNRLQERIDNGTPALIIANAAAKVQSAQNVSEHKNDEGIALNFVRDTTSSTLEKNRPEGLLAGTAASFEEGFTVPLFGIPVGVIGKGGLPGGTAAEEGTVAISRLMMRRTDLLRDGVDSNEVKKVAAINRSIEQLRVVIANQAYPLSPESRLAAAERAERISETRPGLTLDESGNVTRFDGKKFFNELAEDLRKAATTPNETTPVAPGVVGEPVAPPNGPRSRLPWEGDLNTGVVEVLQRLSDGVESQNRLVQEQNILLVEQKAIAEQQAADARRTADATTTTAASTQPRPNYASAQQAAAAAGSAP